MANTASAKKRIRQTARRTARNRSDMSRLRTFVKKVETAIGAGAEQEARAALRALQPVLMRAAAKGLVHRNLVARKLSRLARRVKATAPA
jgi:small subunit ribosomal protein S20